MHRPAQCGACGSDVLWTITDAGKRLAVNARPDPEGNTAAYRDGTGTWRSRRPTDELPMAPWERLYMPHVATCSARRPAEPPETTRCLGVINLADERRRRGDRR
ncbi:hypothetical protein B0E38_04737 [Streptomyces sp. 111WW2]|uniref:hypothetical protein n=1 Tax=Streptomyces sp. 111WW2 TaxID=1945515 RepID=UPI000D0C7B26|nr:hypothetical protein [Streptomyces sp. 111WW2]PSK52411.1 hypothetical protein B0E38_04737 [Streptomyces sp. 111WW2]